MTEPSRIAITGAPYAGKRELADGIAERMGLEARHTDDTIVLGWDAASTEVATWFDADGPWVIEGVAVPRALKKWLRDHPGKPCDVLVVRELPLVALTSRQEGMRKGIATQLADIRGELEARGVELRPEL